jgi:hypothetical protein
MDCYLLLSNVVVRKHFWLLSFHNDHWSSRSSLQIKRNCSQREKDSCFITKAAWLSSEINIHTLTAIIILVSEGRLPSYALNVHLFSSQPCESTFRSARALTGTLSTITNFSVIQFMNKIEKISFLNQVKSLEEAQDIECSLKFPIHHKHRHKDTTASANGSAPLLVTTADIQKIVAEAYDQARSVMNSLGLSSILKKNDFDDFKNLNAFVFEQLTEKSTVDYSYFNEDDLYDVSDENSGVTADIADEGPESDSETDENCLEEGNQDDCHMITCKDTFQGMRIFDKINPLKKSHYFQITINNKLKFLHKQTAARLLSTSKNCLSSDRILRIHKTREQQ